MKAFWNSAVALLVVSGIMLGLSLPLGRLAIGAGVPPVVWAFVISAGGGSVILAILLARGQRMNLTAGKLCYFLVTAIITYAIPNFLLFSVMPHVGAGYAGIMYTLSPIVTLALSMLSGVSRPGRLGAIGIGVGFAGALMVAATRGQIGEPAALSWIGLALLLPLSLAAGNIYRTAHWPEGASSIELAAGSNLAAAAILLAGIAIFPGLASLSQLGHVPWHTLAQIAAASTMFVVFFRLQVVGGPVYLSQIGYVAAAIGLLSGMLFLDERYGWLTWLGALVIAAGVVVTTKAQAEGRR